MKEIIDISDIKEKLKKFASERDWEQFHSPKNLTMALSVEAAELVEIFQWLTEKQSHQIKDDKKQMEHIREEVADILLYLIRFSQILDIDIEEAIKNKFKKNGEKYTIEKSAEYTNTLKSVGKKK